MDSEDGESPSQIIEGFESIQLEDDDVSESPPRVQNHGEKSFDEFVGCKSSGKQAVMDEPSAGSDGKDSRPAFYSIDEDGLHGTSSKRNEFWCVDRPSTSSSRGLELELSLLEEIIKVGKSDEIRKLVVILESCFVDLMKNKRLTKALKKILEQCSLVRKDLVVEYVLARIPFFIEAASSKQGASSMIGFLTMVKRPRVALFVTRLLSPHFFAMMTSHTAKEVILHCFSYFPQHTNKVLYEKAIDECRELAMHKVGCRSLNELITIITPTQGIPLLLLNAIADCSDSLSCHPYGNYVVQNVVSLGMESISDAIVLRIRGEIVQLAKQQGGSRVLEKCMEASELGLSCVVREICGTPGACIQLALDQVGNYVIQKALKRTKESGRPDLHAALLKSLKPHKKQLSQTIGGHMVLALLKQEPD